MLSKTLLESVLGLSTAVIFVNPFSTSTILYNSLLNVTYSPLYLVFNKVVPLAGSYKSSSKIYGSDCIPLPPDIWIVDLRFMKHIG